MTQAETSNPLFDYRLRQFASEMIARYPFRSEQFKRLEDREDDIRFFLVRPIIPGHLPYIRNWLSEVPCLSAAGSKTILAEVAHKALSSDKALKMNSWHSDCGTAHCIAGWAITVAGEPGTLLEDHFSPFLAGVMLLGREAALHFFDGQEEAKAYLHSVLDSDS